MGILDTVFEDIAADEGGLLLVFLVVGLYMFVEAGSYEGVIGLYPRLLSAVVVGCSLLLLFRNILPAGLQRYVAESTGQLAGVDVSEELGATDVDEASARESTTVSNQTSAAQVKLTVLVGGFLLLSYLIGMYFATPVFVLAYGVVYDLDWKMTGLLTALAWVAAHLFLVVFNAPIASGALL